MGDAARPASPRSPRTVRPVAKGESDTAATFDGRSVAARNFEPGPLPPETVVALAAEFFAENLRAKF
jgi:hypothetical protein